ncbi:MAG: hypothetical protein KGL12_04035 [Rhodospirillales bacterium]|nr:hypothetical protein [Rhodospirillales bacterium]
MPLLDRRLMLTGAALAGLALAAGPGFAAAPPAAAPPAGVPMRLRGTIVAVHGSTIALRLRDGKAARAVLAPDAHILWLIATRPDAIAKGSYIGTAAMPQKDGTLRALEVQVFPPAMRGVGEGFHPFDTEPGATMTNGTIGTLTGAHGQTMTVLYKGGEKTVFVPPGVPFVRFAPTSRAALRPGAHVLVNATATADGPVLAHAVLVGKDGLVPPM